MAPRKLLILGAGFGSFPLATELDPPSPRGIEGKLQFERERFGKWVER